MLLSVIVFISAAYGNNIAITTNTDDLGGTASGKFPVDTTAERYSKITINESKLTSIKFTVEALGGSVVENSGNGSKYPLAGVWIDHIEIDGKEIASTDESYERTDKSHGYHATGLDPDSIYKVKIFWEIYDHMELVRSGIEYDSIKTKTPKITAETIKKNTTWVKISVTADNTDGYNPTERGIRLEKNGEYIKGDLNIVILSDMYPDSSVAYRPYAIYAGKRCIGNTVEYANTYCPELQLHYDNYQVKQTSAYFSDTDIAVNYIQGDYVEFKSRGFIVEGKTQHSLSYSGLEPNHTYSVTAFVEYANGHKYEQTVRFSTSDIGIAIYKTTSADYPTTISVSGKGEYSGIITKQYFTGYEDEGTTVIIDKQEPGSKCSVTFTVETKEGYSRSVTKYFYTEKLKFGTPTVKVVNDGTAVISATTNIFDRGTSAGFEWRKTDAPDVVVSKFSEATVCNGNLDGRITNLSNSYYKVRPYYKSGNGNYYYGEWTGFDPSDFSYFEPIVHTYGNANVTASSAKISGVAIQGTDEVTKYGFEYWSQEKSTAKTMPMRAEEHNVVYTEGERLEAIIEGLLPLTTYEYRAFAETAKGTTFGETKEFRTHYDVTDINGVTDNSENNISVSIDGSRRIRILANPTTSRKCQYAIYTISGKCVSRGQVEADYNWHNIQPAILDCGLYIIKAINGSQKISMKLSVK